MTSSAAGTAKIAIVGASPQGRRALAVMPDRVRQVMLVESRTPIHRQRDGLEPAE
jgi:hypothetical protein